MKKALSLALACILLFSLIGCKETGTPPSDEVLLERARVLIPETQIINRLFYEEGISYNSAGTSQGVYYPARAEELSVYGFTTTADILAYMRGIWSDDYVRQIEQSAIFKSVAGTTGMGSYAYCYDSYDKNGAFLCIMVNSQGLPIQTDPVVYDLDTLSVIEKSPDRARVSLYAIVYGPENATKTVQLDLMLVLEDGAWMLASGTAVKYPKHD